jgi:hypothetical protein
MMKPYGKFRFQGKKQVERACLSILDFSSEDRTKILIRFWEKVQKTETCWNWDAAINPNGGHGRFSLGHGSSPSSAPRVSYELAKGRIQEGRNMLHLCGNARCVNPTHLETSTSLRNYCRVCGSELTEDNWGPYDARNHQYTCNECHSKSKRGWQLDNPEKAAEAARLSARRKRIRVMEKVAGSRELRCVYCGCDDNRLLEINHKNGGGNKELARGKVHLFLGGILKGTRTTDDLELTCKPCNALAYLKSKYGELTMKVVWKKR